MPLTASPICRSVDVMSSVQNSENLAPSVANMTGREMRKARTSVVANWLATPP